MMDFKNHNFKEMVYLSDSELTKTYRSQGDPKYKTNLLGLELGCDKKFEIFPVSEKIDPKEFSLSDIEQGYIGNCSFITVLRTIMRRYPQAILNMIKEVDSKHVEIELYGNNEEKPIPITYKIEKTFVIPTYPESLYNKFCFTFFSAHKESEKPWVKLIEKALVLQCMKRDYHSNLVNIQHYGHNFSFQEGKGVIPSYEDVIYILGNNDIYFSLLGCQIKKEFFYEMSKSKKIIRENFNKGELITVDFFENELGLEENHTYELVDFAEGKEEEFVILSNPWGLNQKKNKYSFKNIDTLLSEEIKNDKGIVILPLKNFYEIVQSCTMTCNLADSFGHYEKMQSLKQPTQSPKSKSSYLQFFKPAVIGAGIAMASAAGLLYLCKSRQ